MEDFRAARTIEDLPESYNAAEDLIAGNLAAGRAEKTAVIDARGATSYGMLSKRIDRMANALRRLGITREQRILLCLLDTVDFPTAFLGAIKAGIVPVPLNTLLTESDYRWIVANSGAAAVLVEEELSDRWIAIARDNPDTTFISTGNGPWPGLAALLAAVPDQIIAPASTHRDETAFWLYTSGSTGNPKGTMHTHASLRLTANLYGLGLAGYREDDVVLSVAKQFFAYGLGNSLTFPCAAGATAVLCRDRSTPEAIGALMRDHGVSILCGVPTFFAAWLGGEDAPGRGDVPRLRLAISAGEALPAHLGRAFRERFGSEVLDGLGSTEMLHIFLSQRPGEVRDGCTGREVPGYEVRVVDEHGSTAPPDAVGELQVRGPTMASGYWRNRPKSVTTFLGEWMRTGDKYRCDEEGWFTFCGRSDDMMKVGGIYVSPIEVEEALSSNENVLQAAVVGAKDGDGLTKPCAYIVLKPGRSGDDALEAALKAHVKSQLAPYKYPRWIRFVDELPKTVTGKIQRFRLREEHIGG